MVKKEENPHDYSSGEDKAVELVVRKGHRYGGSVEGITVIVDEREMKNRSTMAALMTFEERDRMAAEQLAAEMRKVEAAKSKVQSIVQAGLERLLKEAKKINALRKVDLAKQEEAEERAKIRSQKKRAAALADAE